MCVETMLRDCETLFRQYDIDIAYLFGSHATGTDHDKSDVDVALVLSEPEGRERIPELERRLSQRLEMPADCRVLNDGDSRFIYTVLRTGRPVYVADDDVRREFEHQAMRTYLDMKPFYDEYDRYVKDRLTA